MAVTISGSTGISGAPLQRGTETVTTSGTSVVIATGIPDWVNRVTVMIYGLSTSGTSAILLQFGTGSAPTYVTTGYVSSTDNYASAAGPVATSTAGFRLGSSTAAATVWYATYVFTNLGSNKWVGSLMGAVVSNSVGFGGGGITLAAPLTAMRFTTAGGTEVFDAGSVNYIYE